LFKFFAAFRKEWLILIRDVAGLIVLFIMPMLMVVILALVQEYGWSTVAKEPRIPVLFVDLDQDSLSRKIERGLTSDNFFTLVKEIDSEPLTPEQVKKLVKDGRYQIGVILPGDATKKMRAKIQLMVNKIMSSLTMPDIDIFQNIINNDSIDVIIYFDPVVRPSFRNSFTSSMREYSIKIEAEMIFETFQAEIRNMFPNFTMPLIDYQRTTNFHIIFPAGKDDEKYPSPTQHNVPAWAIFAMFFIVIPLSSTMIKERDEGNLIRLMTIPVSYITIFMAKVGVYLIVCFLQFVLMVLAGIYILPLFHLPPLETGTHYFAIAVMTITASLAALGYGIMIGTIAKTHQQAAAFGSVSIVILTAIGGLWVPVYLMPNLMKVVASYSPLNWAYNGFLDLFLRGGDLVNILPDIGKLLIFFMVTIAIAAIYRKFNPPINT